MNNGDTALHKYEIWLFVILFLLIDRFFNSRLKNSLVTLNI